MPELDHYAKGGIISAAPIDFANERAAEPNRLAHRKTLQDAASALRLHLEEPIARRRHDAAVWVLRATEQPRPDDITDGAARLDDLADWLRALEVYAATINATLVPARADLAAQKMAAIRWAIHEIRGGLD